MDPIEEVATLVVTETRLDWAELQAKVAAAPSLATGEDAHGLAEYLADLLLWVDPQPRMPTTFEDKFIIFVAQCRKMPGGELEESDKKVVLAARLLLVAFMWATMG